MKQRKNNFIRLMKLVLYALELLHYFMMIVGW